ncbi:MAG: hypothetical protein PHO37_15305 [Kiritimatiellae bacterium]|nr:hypothetical protein [Kiritimatiellia bacterium]
MKVVSMLKVVVTLFCLTGVGQIWAQSEKSYLWAGDKPGAEDPMMKAVAAFLEANEHYNLASWDGSAARVRPIKFCCVMNNALVLATSNKKEMYRQMKEFPKVELSRVANDKSAYIRYLGKAVECKDPVLEAAVLAVHPWPRANFKEDMALFMIEPEMAGIFSMKGEPAKTKNFKD